MNAIVREFEKSQILRKEVPFKIGDTVRVQVRIKEGEKERLQTFEGLVTAMKGTLGQMHFTVRKISYGVGVEKAFLFQSPLIKEIKVVRSGKIRRAKLYYLRAKLSKKDARIEEKKKGTKGVSAVPVTGDAPSAEDLTPQLAPVEKVAPKADASTVASEAPKA
jgi:large subunit ribosomal protein L19